MLSLCCFQYMYWWIFKSNWNSICTKLILSVLLSANVILRIELLINRAIVFTIHIIASRLWLNKISWRKNPTIQNPSLTSCLLHRYKTFSFFHLHSPMVPRVKFLENFFLFLTTCLWTHLPSHTTEMKFFISPDSTKT